MSKILGQQVTIENAGGAGGTIGTGRVVRADPDGYTLLIYHVGLATAATLYRKLPYDTKSAFAAIGLVTEAPMTIIGRPDLPPDSRVLAFVPDGRRFRALRDKVTSSAQSLVPSRRGSAQDRGRQS
jgi:hypothetical protein